MATRNLIFDIFAIDRASEVFSRVGTEAELSGAKVAEAGRKAASGFIEAAAIIGFGTASIKAASEFQASMQRINTLAMGGKAPLADLSKQVIALAGQVGYSPNSLSEALYHIESNFYTVGLGGKQAMDALKVAAEGAQIGGANLVDVTNALGAAVASGIPGVKNYKVAMQDLLTTVGIGDMTMQNLADAFSNGLLAVGKQYGVTLKDVSAALATFGDNNIRGSEAATYLRMSIMDLTKQSQKGEFALSQIGLATGQLKRDLETGGLNKALTDLHDHLDKAGITGTKVGSVLVDAFTKKSSAPLAVLLGQFDRLQSKYAALQGMGAQFDSAWAARQKTAAQNFADLTAAFDSFKIVLGDTVIPVITKFTGVLTEALTWMSSHQTAVTALAGALSAALVPALIGVGVAMGAISAPIVAFAAVGAAFAVLYQHSAKFRDIIHEVGTALGVGLKATINWLTTTGLPAVKTGFQIAWHAAADVVTWFINGPLAWIKTQLAGFENWYHAHAQQIATITRAAWAVVSTEIKVAWTVIRGVVQIEATAVVNVLRLAWGIVRDGTRMAWDAMRDIVKTTLSVVIDAVAMFVDLFTGHWGKAWNDAKKLVSDALNGITGFIADFGSNAASLLLDAGKNLIQGFINGIKSSFGAVQGVLGDLTKMLPSWKGPEDLDKRILTPAGRSVIDSFIAGIRERRSAVKAELAAITADITAVGNKIQAAQAFSGQWMGNIFSAATQAMSASGTGSPSAPSSSGSTGNIFSISSLGSPASASTAPTTSVSPLQAMLDFANQQATQSQALYKDIIKIKSMGATAALLAQIQNASPSDFAAIDALANGGKGNVSTLNSLLSSAQTNSLNAGAQLVGASSYKSLQIKQRDEQRLENLLNKVLHDTGKKVHVTDPELLQELKALRGAMEAFKAQNAANHKTSQALATKAPHEQAKVLNHQARKAKNK
jgi:TP901 family phage tail tape measure protein